MSTQRGFTLLEVLVALAIFAVVAASVLATSARSLQNAARLEDKTLAMWIADNRLAEMQLAATPPGTGATRASWISPGAAGSGRARWRRPPIRPCAAPRSGWPSATTGAPGQLEERAAARLVGFIETRQ